MRAIANSMTTTKKVLRFAMLPGLSSSMAPVSEAWVLLARLLVQVFASMGLIEKSHPWMRATAKPRLLEVLSIVWAKIDWKHAYRPAPMVAVSITLMLAFGAVAAVFFASSFVLGAGQAFAASGPSLFSTPSPSTDLALKYISQAFGVPIDGVPSGAVDGVVEGFQQIMGLYSVAMLVLGGFILLYIISFAVMSTAHEGRFGGGSFNQVWAPIRLVVAIGLLVPLPMSGFNGYNSGQYIVMKLAELGSALATNLWVPFATSLASKGDVLGKPAIGPTLGIVTGVLRNEFCLTTFNFIKNELTNDRSPDIEAFPQNATGGIVRYNYTSAVDPSGSYCGSVSYEKVTVSGVVAQQISNGYETAFLDMKDAVAALALQLAGAEYIWPIDGIAGKEKETRELLAENLPKIVDNYSQALGQAIQDSQSAANTAARDALSNDVKEAGWAGAAMWFNTIARLNTEIMAASRALPTTTGPQIAAANSTIYTDVTISKTLRPRLADLDQLLTPDALSSMFNMKGLPLSTGAITSNEAVVAPSIYAGLVTGQPVSQNAWDQVKSAGGSLLSDKLKQYFADGTGVFGSIGVGEGSKLSEINPLAELALIGDWILDKSLAMLAGGTLANLMITPLITLLIFGFGSMGVGAGILLVFVLPLMPFIRFLFSVVGWILNILEAIIAIPLVAIAHLTTKGEGISGDLARTSYFMVLSIFLRPALMIVGLIAALMMFTVAVGILNDMYQQAVVGFRGTSTAGTGNGLSTFLYTILYVVIAYNLCNMCFKLMEEIPNRALTWINQSAAKEIPHDENVARIMTGAGTDFIGVFGNTGKQVQRLGKK